MLFAPYPPEGGVPQAANFWMHNTPSPLDIIFIRPDGTIATIAENTTPFFRHADPVGRAGVGGTGDQRRALGRARHRDRRQGDVEQVSG